MFPEDVQQEAARRYQRIQAEANRCQRAGMAWVAGVLGGGLAGFPGATVGPGDTARLSAHPGPTAAPCPGGRLPGLAGVFAIAMPLTNVGMRTCAIFPTPGWTVGVLWAIVVLGVLLGGLLLTVYQLWASKRDLSAWRALASGDGAVHSGSWGTLWWWVLLSYLVLVGGVVVSVVVQQFFFA